jgi:hypothetical protein
MRIPVASMPIPARGCDCSVCPFFTGNPAAVEPICSGTNSDCSYCGCARTAGMAGTAACGSCSVRCGSRTDIAAWMADVGGTLSFDDIALARRDITLPGFVPMVDAAATVAKVDAGLAWPAYAIGLRRVWSPKTGRIRPTFEATTAHAALGLAEGQAAVLVGYGEDPIVERFWTLRRAHGLIEAIAAMEWDLVLAPNYSMYGNWPRAQHLLSYRMNLVIAQELANAGVPVAPNLYWFRREDLDRTIAWIADTEPVAVAVNVQTCRTDSDWNDILAGLTYLAVHFDDLPAPPRMVITGASRADRIAALVDLFGPRLTLVSQNPLQYAAHGAVMTPEGRRDVHAHAADAFATSVRYYASLLDQPAPAICSRHPGVVK